MSEKIYDLIVIGSGPGGYVAAIRAAQLGFSVAVVEKRAALGGVCLNEGCIPSKSLLESSEHFSRLHHELADHGIEVSGVKLDLKKMITAVFRESNSPGDRERGDRTAPPPF